MLDSDALYHVWAPPDSPWSPWVKPVLIAHFQTFDERLADPLPPVDVTWAPTAEGRTAIVCDRRGAIGVATGLALAERGYRPVPLYNALPSPHPLTARAVVDVDSILWELARSSPSLASLQIPPKAPPAFLLDATRRTGSAYSGLFDNRSVSFPSDFPSANLLQLAGITQVLLVQDLSRTPLPDLAPTLHAWQQAGIGISALAVGIDQAPRSIDVRKPSWWSRLWQWLFTSLALHGNARRGFGGFVPQSG
jgi:hypothetical protein